MSETFSNTPAPDDPSEPSTSTTVVPGSGTVTPVADTPPAPAYDPATDPTITAPADVPTRPDSSNLQTDRVWKEGDPDFDAASDTSHTAQGNRYPQSYDSAAAEADAADAEVTRLEGQLDLARDVANAARAKADYLKDNAKVSSPA